MLALDRTQPLRKLRRRFEFLRQAFIQRVGGNPPPGQKPVKLRGRHIQIPRNLLELRMRFMPRSSFAPENRATTAFAQPAKIPALRNLPVWPEAFVMGGLRMMILQQSRFGQGAP